MSYYERQTVRIECGLPNGDAIVIECPLPNKFADEDDRITLLTSQAERLIRAWGNSIAPHLPQFEGVHGAPEEGEK